MGDHIFAFHKSVRGFRHIQEDIPCQDSSISCDRTAVNGEFQIAAIGDGHGDPACHRSSQGSGFAVDVAKECLNAFANAILTDNDNNKMDVTSPRQRQECMEQLTKTIVSKWYKRVENDLQENEVTEEDLEDAGSYEKAYRNNERLEHLYGTTLIAALKLGKYLFLIQQGDGRCDVFYADGTVEQPIPWDDKCKGATTTSMCDEAVVTEIRSAVIVDTEEKRVAACYLGSDGVEDSYYDNEETQLGTHRFYRELSCKLCEKGTETFEEYLGDYLPEFSRRGSADDVSVAGIVDVPAIFALTDCFQKEIIQYDRRESLQKRLVEVQGIKISMSRKYEDLKRRVESNGFAFETAERKRACLKISIQDMYDKKNEIEAKAEKSLRDLECCEKEYLDASEAMNNYDYFKFETQEFIAGIVRKMYQKKAIYDGWMRKLRKSKLKLKQEESSLRVLEEDIQSLQELSETEEKEFEEYEKKYNEIDLEIQKLKRELDFLA